jgi:hypothetical protein
MSEAPAEPQPSQPQPPPLPFLYPSRIITFSLLAVALVALGFDQVARFKANTAFGKLQGYVDEEAPPDEAAASAEPCTPSHAKMLLGRTPDSEEKSKEETRQTYSWQGVFNRYHVHAAYGGVTLAAEKPEDAEPLLLRVEQSSNYIWNN